jgi:hypothetical protein
MRYKIIQLTSYGSKCYAENRNLSHSEALKKLAELQNLNPDNVYQIEKM